jgi:hypothetical protein
MKTLNIKRDSKLGTCTDCGKTTTTIVTVKDVPKHISITGYLSIPFCDACLAASPFVRNA